MENSVSYETIDYKVPVAIIIGSEGFGMSNLVKKNCDFIANIPMYGKINSLNASVSCGIILSYNEICSDIVICLYLFSNIKITP